ncbi:MAG: hypothetical protein IKW83_03665 [Muribaculaceae bacterium]|nr:hypothetical protein [Muribaculaceae bacterium]
MKKSLLFLLTIVSVAMFVSCGGDKKSGSGSDASEENIEGVKYENKDFGYLVVLPEGFEQQNDDAKMEKERGGKLFLGDGCTIDVTCSKMNYIGDTTPEASIDQSIEMVKALNEGAEVEKLDAVSFVSKSQDDNYLRAHYELQKNGNKYMIDFTYTLDKKDQFDKDVEAVVKSFKAE